MRVFAPGSTLCAAVVGLPTSLCLRHARCCPRSDIAALQATMHSAVGTVSEHLQRQQEQQALNQTLLARTMATTVATTVAQTMAQTMAGLGTAIAAST